MGLKGRVAETPIYYEERSVQERRRRFCLKPIKLVQSRVGREEGAVNIDVTKGGKTCVNIDNTEAKKITDHFDNVTDRLQRLHKSVIWSMHVGRSFLDRVEPSPRPGEETNIVDMGGQAFEVTNGRSWSRESLAHIENSLRAQEVSYDGLVCLFSVATQADQPDIDCDEVCWEVEKVLTYHTILSSSQRILNPEGAMARRGGEPVSRKVRTPGRNRAGYVVYLAYQLVEGVTLGQVMVETVVHSVDIEAKKKQVLHLMGNLRLAPPVDDRLRKVVREVRTFLTRDQVEILHQVTRVQEQEKLSVVAQFLHILSGSQTQKQGGLAGLNQFVTFLSSQQEEPKVRRTSSQASGLGPPRPSLTRSNSARSRKQSSSSFSSCSTTPETPQRCNSAGSTRSSAAPVIRRNGRNGSASTRERRRSNLADIQSDGSMSSSSETLLRVAEEGEGQSL